jgi:predicted transglutaminase-like cysteine proteinase
MYSLLKRAICAAFLLTILGQTQTYAVGLSGQPRMPSVESEKLFIREKTRGLEPFAHVMFCMDTPAECATSQGADMVQFDRDTKRIVMDVNRRINRQIAPVSDDGAGAGLDKWSLAPESGDCEDFAITKRHELIRAGVPAAALRLATARTAWGEGHLVLILRTDEGDMVLDNMTDAIRNFRKTGLKLHQIQATGNPRIWYNI